MLWSVRLRPDTSSGKSAWQDEGERTSVSVQEKLWALLWKLRAVDQARRTAAHCVIDPKVPMEQYEKLRSSYSLPISCKYVFASELELHSRMMARCLQKMCTRRFHCALRGPEGHGMAEGEVRYRKASEARSMAQRKDF